MEIKNKSNEKRNYNKLSANASVQRAVWVCYEDREVKISLKLMKR